MCYDSICVKGRKVIIDRKSPQIRQVCVLTYTENSLESDKGSNFHVLCAADAHNWWAMVAKGRLPLCILPF